MGASWYLNQNLDVKTAQLNPLIHYLKYGRLEGRTWFMPVWFMNALGLRGWVWKDNKEILTRILGTQIFEYQNFSRIEIIRLGIYDSRDLTK